MNENIKDSNALGKEVSKVHQAICKLFDYKKEKGIVCNLETYIKQNESTLQSM